MIAKFKNIIFVALLSLIFIEVLIIFPSHLEKPDSEQLIKSLHPEEKKDEKQDTGITSLTGQKMEGVHLVESLQGVRDWELFAESAEGSQGSGSWQLKKVRVLFYNKEKVEFIVTGDTGRIEAKNKDFSVTGNVETKSENGYHFQTPSIFYYSKKRIIESPEQVKVQGPQEADGGPLVFEGKKMKVVVDESKIYIDDEVTAKKTEKGGKPLSVQAGGVELSGKNREIKFKGSVSLQYENMKIEGPSAVFSYQGGADRLADISFFGGIKVSDNEKMATSESVDLNLLANKYVFKGSPKVIQNNDEIMGEEIVFLEGGKKVRVEKVRAKVENVNQ